MANETIVTYDQGGKTYEIDHLGAADWDSVCRDETGEATR